ncbi:MAG: AAA-like domain-containing protein [Polyangia bacterium]
MSQKVLRQTTIIPPELYIPREADRQLRSVLNDMGRPGYVLVARQMGKTNLILHAKREMEDENNIFVYVDLTNRLPTLKDCFRNIIDIALESHGELDGKVGQEIRSRRAAYDHPAHKEHEMDLRCLLRAISGKLVIILDEIDALTSQDYSDQLFAQIRSTFFSSRVNFSEFHRLTYVLSGVAEPTEIIKNPKISPFNIGLKIYLEDFSYDEYRNFVAKASLKISISAIDRIFSWANGNPRMTWDICSAVEDSLLGGKEITTEVVDEIVHKLYLENFDLPPIDHIRTLVENDRTIRNAVMEMRYGKGNEISDAVRTRLYLAGITKATDSDGPRIKNKIIDLSLSEQWITDIEKKKLGTHRLAVEKFKAKQFSEAIPLFEDHLRNNATSDTDRILTANSIAHCFLYIGKYEEALDYFQRTYGTDEDSVPEIWAAQKHGIGWCHFHLGAHDEAQAELWNALKISKTAVPVAITSLWLLGKITTQKDTSLLNVEELEIICKRIIDRLRRDSEVFENERIIRFKTRVFLSMALLCSRLERLDRADYYLRRAIEECGQIEKTAIQYYAFKLERDDDKKETMAISCANEVLNQDLSSRKLQPDELPILTKEDFLALLLKLYEKKEWSLFEKIIDQVLVEFGLDRVHALYELAVLSIGPESAELTKELVGNLMNLIQSGAGKTQLGNRKTRDVYKFFLILNAETLTSADEHKYKEHLDLLFAATTEELKTFDSLEVMILTNWLYYLARKLRYDEAAKLLEQVGLIRERVKVIDHLLVREFSVIDYIAMSLMKSVGNKQASKTYARSAYSVLREDKSGFVIKVFAQNEETIDRIFTQVATEASKSEPAKRSQEIQYKRNEKVRVRDRDGNIIEKKYKQLEDAIKKGIYTIIND